MKSFVVFALLVAAAVAAPAAPAGPEAGAVILKHASDNIGVGDSRFSYETSNGISEDREIFIENAGTENESVSFRGQFSYPGPDGLIYTVTYVANKDGFQPSAPHLPVAP